MAKIVYGVSGEGSGHSSRATEILSHLTDKGHQIKVASYDRGYRNLKDQFDVLEIAGLKISSHNNKVSAVRTLLDNLKILPDGIKQFQVARRELFKQFKPDCVITDFEPTTAYLAGYYDVPLISIDNQHRMRYMEYERPSQYAKDAFITEAIIRAMVPSPDVSLVTTFHKGKLKNDHTFLFPPILRKSVTDLQPSNKGHILVYATAGFDSLLDILHTFTRERFVVYGYNKDETLGNLQFRPFSQQGFLDDLASSKAVIATAGFTLITESLYLKKPYLALPMQGQFEQVLNALMLDELGYGKSCLELGEEHIAAFLYKIPDYNARLMSYPQEKNEQITTFLDVLLDNDLEKLRQFQQRN